MAGALQAPPPSLWEGLVPSRPPGGCSASLRHKNPVTGVPTCSYCLHKVADHPNASVLLLPGQTTSTEEATSGR